MPNSTKKRSWRFGAALAAVALALACAPGQPFMPTERLTAFSPQGFLAAEYDLTTTQGADLGQVRVWSSGAERVRFRGQRRALIHVGIEIQNESDTPLVVDSERMRLDSATVNGTVFENIAPAQIDGDAVIPPGEEATIHVYFAMRPGVYPTDVRAFRFRWALRDDGVVYKQRTPFMQEPTPYYDPYWYGGWGWGPGWWGAGWGWGPGWGPGGMYGYPYPYFHYRRW